MRLCPHQGLRSIASTSAPSLLPDRIEVAILLPHGCTTFQFRFGRFAFRQRGVWAGERSRSQCRLEMGRQGRRNALLGSPGSWRSEDRLAHTNRRCAKRTARHTAKRFFCEESVTSVRAVSTSCHHIAQRRPNSARTERQRQCERAHRTGVASESSSARGIGRQAARRTAHGAQFYFRRCTARHAHGECQYGDCRWRRRDSQQAGHVLRSPTIDTFADAKALVASRPNHRVRRDADASHSLTLGLLCPHRDR